MVDEREGERNSRVKVTVIVKERGSLALAKTEPWLQQNECLSSQNQQVWFYSQSLQKQASNWQVVKYKKQNSDQGIENNLNAK